MQRSIRLLAALLSIASASAIQAQPPPPSTFSITKTDIPDPVIPGNLLTFSISAENEGPQAVLNMLIQDSLPAETVFISAVASPGATLTTPAVGSNGQVSSQWDAAGGTPGGLTAVDQVRTTTIVVRTCPETGCVDIANTADVSGESSSTPNMASSSTAATPQSDLSISKRGPTGPVLTGSSTTFFLTVANAGPSNSPTTRVVDTLPPGFFATDTASTLTGTVCSISGDGRVVTCDFPIGAANQCATSLSTSGTIRIEATVAPETDAGVYTNIATIGINGPCGTDPNMANNTSTAEVLVIGTAGAPVASPLGLLMLTLVLGAAGAWMLRRRRAQ